MSLKIVSADERLAQQGMPKILISGPPKIGKTTLLKTVNPKTTLFVDLEAGDLAVQDVPVDTVQPRTWPECRDLACYLGGPNPALKADSAYSQAHYDAIKDKIALDRSKYDLYFLDSLTVASRLCFQWAMQQPEAVSEKTGNTDTRAVYGMLGREMVAWITHIQHIRDKAIVFVCILEKEKDEYGRVAWGLQIEGQKVGRELPGIVDEIIAMVLIQTNENGEPEEGGASNKRFFVCKQTNPEGYPAGDRSGRLDMLEPADLGALLAKLTARPAATHSASKAA